MHLEKKINSQYMSAVRYELDEKRLRIVMADGAMVEFSGVPTNLFHGMPSGETCASYYMEKLRGRFPMQLLRRAPTAEEIAANQPLSRLDKQIAEAKLNKQPPAVVEDSVRKPKVLKPQAALNSLDSKAL